MKKSVVAMLFTMMLIVVVFTSKADQTINRYYYNQLEDFQRQIYDFELTVPHETAIYNLPIDADLSLYSEEEIIHKAIDALHACDSENPMKTRWLGAYSVPSVNIEKNTIDIQLICSDYYSENDDQRIEEIISAIVDGADESWDMYTKASYISSSITSCMVYDMDYVLYNSESKPNYDKQHLTGILNGVAVCEGYTELFVELANRLDLNCIEVSSKGHAFVHIQMEDGKWYGIEPQSELCLQGDSMYQGELLDTGWENIYEVFDGAYFYISQPHRAINDYAYAGTEPLYDIVDVESIRSSQLGDEAKFGYTINADDTTCTITSYEGSQIGDLYIPETIDGYTVTSIGNSAFAFCKYFNGSLIMPDTIETIEESAFAHCTGLSGDLRLPNNLVRIMPSAFISCSGFNGTIIFNDALEYIGTSAFANCNHLTGSLLLPDNLEVIESDAFYACSNLNGIVHIPMKISKWSAQYFESCHNLASFDIDDNHPKYTVHNQMLFTKDMTTLVHCINSYKGNVEIPEGTITIDDYAFYGCEGVESIKYPTSLINIGTWAFGHMSGMESHDLILPSSVNHIGDYAFYSNNIAGTIYYPKTNNVGTNAFGWNLLVTRVIIPEGVTTLPANCFSTIILSEVHLPASIAELPDNYFLENSSSLIVYGEPGSYAASFVDAVNQHYDWASYQFKALSRYWREETRFLLEAQETHYPSHVQLSVIDTETNETATLTNWKSSDEAVATVSANGLVSALTYGSITIEATAESGEVFTWDIICCLFPTEMKVSVGGFALSDDGENESITTLHPGDTTYIQEYYPGGWLLIAPESDKYPCLVTSNDPRVIKITGNELRALRTGSAVITISNLAGFSVSTTFYVKNAPMAVYPAESEIKLHTSVEASLPNGLFEKKKIELSYEPENTFTVISTVNAADPDIVRVEQENGEWFIYGAEEGETIITVTTKDGLLTEINAKVCRLMELSSSKKTLWIGCKNESLSELSLKIEYQFEYDTNVEVVFHSAMNLVMIDENGLLTAEREGSDEICALIYLPNGDLLYQSNWVKVEIRDIENESYRDNMLLLPNSLLSIGEESFANTNASWIVIPNGVKDIGVKAFANCKNLKAIQIPPSVMSISTDAFSDCNSPIIIGTANSFAQLYAEQYGFDFEPMD